MTEPPKPRRPSCYVFCDESHTHRRSKCLFRVQAGIWVPRQSMGAVREAFKNQRAKHPTFHEYKWERINGSTLKTAYVDLVDMFFEMVTKHAVTFNCFVVAHADDPGLSLGKMEKDLSFYRSYFTFLNWRLDAGTDYYLRIDEKASTHEEPEAVMQRCLNAAAIRDMKDPFKVLESIQVRSKDEDMVQLADVLAGAVGWAWNDQQSTCAAKPIMHQRICDGLKWKTLKSATGGSAKPFNIWKYRPPRKT